MPTPSLPSVRKIHTFVLLVAAVVAILLAVYRTQQVAVIAPLPSPSPMGVTIEAATPSSQLYRVVQVVDGDTIKVEINGKKETVRFIGIDTPEIVDPRKPVQCFAKQASDKMHQLADGNSVQLVTDPTQGDRDKYQRLLRYIYQQNGTFLNQLMIEEGFAHEYTYNIPYKFQTEFKQAERDAMEQKRGLWADSTCPAPTPVAKKKSGR